MSNKVALHTLGCKLNFSETSVIGKEFLSNGYTIVDFNEKADIYVFNTCTVTENAEKECRQLVRKALRKNPDAYIIVTGCYAQLRPEEIASINGVDTVLGSQEKFNLFDYIEKFEKQNLACIFVSPIKDNKEFGAAHSTDPDIFGRTRAFLKIQDGCDYKCSFCTIPLARGFSRSMQPNQVVPELKNLVHRGYKEIILTGVNVGDYGKAFNTDLYNLLLNLIDVNGDFRLRISSIEPNLLSDEIIELAAGSDKMCKHFHIPLQSGSNNILRSMRRRYEAGDYSDLIYKIKKRIPDAGIGVDVIVGFPGETEEDFHQTYEFLRGLPVSYLHVFTYSERPDTHALSLPGSVSISERKRRSSMLRILSDKKKSAFYNSMLGKELQVLFESENTDGKMKGFSSNYIRVSHDFDESLVNNLCGMKITGINHGLCEGTVINRSSHSAANNFGIDLIAC